MLYTITANYERDLTGSDVWGDCVSGQITTFMVDAYSPAEAESKATDILTRTCEDKGEAVTLHMDVRPTLSEVIERWLADVRGD